MSGLDLERVVLSGAVIDGTPLIRLMRGFKNDYRFAVQLLDLDMLDLAYNETLANGNEIRMSIEVDKWGRRVAAYIAEYKPGDWNRIGVPQARFSDRIRVPFEGFQTNDDDKNVGTILAPFLRKRAGQTLGPSLRHSSASAPVKPWGCPG